jgi:hypothetical protein
MSFIGWMGPSGATCRTRWKPRMTCRRVLDGSAAAKSGQRRSGSTARRSSGLSSGFQLSRKNPPCRCARCTVKRTARSWSQWRQLCECGSGRAERSAVAALLRNAVPFFAEASLGYGPGDVRSAQGRRLPRGQPDAVGADGLRPHLLPHERGPIETKPSGRMCSDALRTSLPRRRERV